jgi:hypothetical protein
MTRMKKQNMANSAAPLANTMRFAVTTDRCRKTPSGSSGSTANRAWSTPPGRLSVVAEGRNLFPL